MIRSFRVLDALMSGCKFGGVDDDDDILRECDRLEDSQMHILARGDSKAPVAHWVALSCGLAVRAFFDLPPHELELRSEKACRGCGWWLDKLVSGTSGDPKKLQCLSATKFKAKSENF